MRNPSSMINFDTNLYKNPGNHTGLTYVYHKRYRRYLKHNATALAVWVWCMQTYILQIWQFLAIDFSSIAFL